jgi:TerC family integral membrane protein
MSDPASLTVPWRRNVAWSVGWISLALAFGVWIAATRGGTGAAEYYAAYLLEKSLSIDNIFVFVIIFSELHIPAQHQRRVLRAGVVGALVLRALVILAGIALIQRFQWVIYPFAALILFAAWRLLFGEQRERQAVAKACDVCGTWIARIVRVSPVFKGDQFWRRERGRLVATPLFVALVVVETTDIVFALDSVPAVLSVTRDPLLVYSSNVMAMLGLRSLYFVVADALHRVRYVRQGLAVVLAFTAAKMLASEWVQVSPAASVAVIAVVLGATILASLWLPRAAAERSGTR